jgi:hypothetical protein
MATDISGSDMGFLSIGATQAYSDGLVTISGDLVTGTGCVFIDAMIGGILSLNTGDKYLIRAFDNSTNLRINSTATVSTPTRFTIYYGGMNCSLGETHIQSIKAKNKLRIGNAAGGYVDLVPQSSNTLSLPTETADLVSLSSTQTLTNKTISDLQIDQISNSGAVLQPATEGVLVGTAETQTLLNKTLDGAKISQIKTPEGATLTMPSNNTTLVGSTSVQTLTNKTLTNPQIDQISSRLSLPSGTHTLMGAAPTQTLTNKIFVNPQISTLVSSGVSLTVPASGTAFATSGGAETLTNKTLSNLVANSFKASSDSSTISLPSSGTLVSLDAAQTLSNKTFGDLAFSSGITHNNTLVSLPASGTLMTTSSADTLTNKTLSSPQISQIVNGSVVLTLPTQSGVLMGSNGTQTLTGISFGDSGDLTKLVQIDTSGSATQTDLELVTQQTTNQTLSIPDLTATDQVLALNTTQTLKNKTLVSATVVDTTDATKTLAFSLSGNTTGCSLDLSTQQTTTQTLLVPNLTATDTIVTANATQTLSGTTVTNHQATDANGNILVKSLNNNANAFVVKNSAGTTLFLVNASSKATSTKNQTLDTGPGLFQSLNQVAVGVPSTSTGSMKFQNQTNALTTTLQPSSLMTSSYTLTAPQSFPANGNVLEVDASGNLSSVPKLLFATGTITDAQIRDTVAPCYFELVPAPGAGKLLIIHNAVLNHYYGTSGLSAWSYNFRYKAPSGSGYSPTGSYWSGFLGSTNGSNITFETNTLSASDDLVNSSFNLYSASNPTGATADGNTVWRVCYSIISFP